MYCYRFPTRNQFRTLAAAEGLINDDGELITSSHTFAVDEVGTITEGGTYDPETGEVITPPVALSGWHVNLIAADAPEAWDQYLVVVNSPARVFLGGPTQAPDSATLEAMAQ
jgi:hypothetical protein